MNTPKAPKIDEPVELEEAPVAETAKVKALTAKQVDALADELGLKRQYTKTAEGKIEVGDYPAFEEMMETDPSGALAREKFEWVKIYIELGASADRITINRKQYFHGHWYNIRAHQVPDFNAIMYQTQRHEAEVFDREGQHNWLNKRKKHPTIHGGRGGQVVVS
jgi:hypothetical protein